MNRVSKVTFKFVSRENTTVFNIYIKENFFTSTEFAITLISGDIKESFYNKLINWCFSRGLAFTKIVISLDNPTIDTLIIAKIFHNIRLKRTEALKNKIFRLRLIPLIP